MHTAYGCASHLGLSQGIGTQNTPQRSVHHQSRLLPPAEPIRLPCFWDPVVLLGGRSWPRIDGFLSPRSRIFVNSWVSCLPASREAGELADVHFVSRGARPAGGRGGSPGQAGENQPPSQPLPPTSSAPSVLRSFAGGRGQKEADAGPPTSPSG